MSKKENSDFSHSTLSEKLNQTKVRLHLSVAVEKYTPVKSIYFLRKLRARECALQ